MAPTTATYRLWRRMSGWPGGTWAFSTAAALRVPYFLPILPHIVRMEPGYAEVRMIKWPLTDNHLRTVHAIAMCNAAELAMGMLMEATVPATHRWIPNGMTVRYQHKATTSLRACAELDPPDFDAITDGAEIAVPIRIYDRFGTEVFRADITTWVTPTT